jgi:SAM-dependent methyltransferase
MEKSEYNLMFHLENEYWWYVGLHQLVEHFVRKMKSDVLVMLDAGCGTGRMMEVLRPYGHIDGFDFSEDAISFCLQRGLTSAKLQDLNQARLNNKYYDVIVSLDVIYHQAIKDDQAILKKFYDALRQQGTLILNLPAFDLLHRAHNVYVHEKRRYRKKQLQQQLKDMGFEIRLATYRLVPLYFMILFLKLFESPVKPAKSDLSKLPGWLNSILLFWHRFENRLIRMGVRFPLGSSLFIIAVKP